MDQSGNVVGVVVSKLDAIAVAKVTRDIPQNVNFAIKARIVEAFLEANNVDYKTKLSHAVSNAAEIAEKAKAFTVPVECRQ